MVLPAERALRPIRAAADEVARLRAAQGVPPRDAFLHVTDAADAALRRLLRDDPGVDLDVRLRALDREELGSDEVIAELRRQDRVSLEFAAAFHELIGAWAQVRGGVAPSPADAALALRVADRIEAEAVRAPAHAPPPTSSGGLPPLTDEPTLIAPPTPVPPLTRRSRRGVAVVALLGALLLVTGILWWRSGRDNADFSEGVARFRSGDLAGAEVRMRRVVEASADDPTPRLYLARIYRRRGERERATQEIRAGLAASPNDPGLHGELGFLLLDAGQPRAATERFRAAVELDPEDVQGWVGLVHALRAAGQPDAAERVTARAPAEARALIGTAASMED